MAVKRKQEKDLVDQAEETVFDMPNTGVKEQPVLKTENVQIGGSTIGGVTESSRSYTEDTVIKMMERFANKLRSEFEDKIAMMRGKETKEEGKKYVDDLMDDWMEIPAVFFTFAFGVSIHGDRSRGIETTPPNGPIRFKPILRSKKKGRHGPQVISVASVKIHSKREAEYLRTHSWFGIKFFESMSEAITVDTTWAQKLVEANQSVQGMSDQQVIARCQIERLPLGTDPDVMRKQLIELIAKRNIKRQEEINIGKIKSSMVGVGDDGVRRVIEERKIID